MHKKVNNKLLLVKIILSGIAKIFRTYFIHILLSLMNNFSDFFLKY